jgi:hypothetical protein
LKREEMNQKEDTLSHMYVAYALKKWLKWSKTDR